MWLKERFCTRSGDVTPNCKAADGTIRESVFPESEDKPDRIACTAAALAHPFFSIRCLLTIQTNAARGLLHILPDPRRFAHTHEYRTLSTSYAGSDWYSHPGSPIRQVRHEYAVWPRSAKWMSVHFSLHDSIDHLVKLYPSESYVTFRGKKAKAMADQLATVSKKRLINPAGSIFSTEMEGIGQAITIPLDF